MPPDGTQFWLAFFAWVIAAPALVLMLYLAWKQLGHRRRHRHHRRHLHRSPRV